MAGLTSDTAIQKHKHQMIKGVCVFGLPCHTTASKRGPAALSVILRPSVLRFFGSSPCRGPVQRDSDWRSTGSYRSTRNARYISVLWRSMRSTAAALGFNAVAALFRSSTPVTGLAFRA